MIERHVFIIGMPGSGKTSLGRRVANNLHLSWADTDQRVQEIAGCTVNEFFEKWGEDAFRVAETNVLMQLTRESPSIISTGGGTVLNDTNRAIMRACGVIVLIDRPVEDIMGDIKLDRRPMLAEKGVEEVRRLYDERIGRYRAAADVAVDNSRGYANAMRDLELIARRVLGA